MLTINPTIFKAYDIRGIFNQDFDADFAYYLGLAYVELLKKDGIAEGAMKIAVGGDMRLSTPALREKLLAGLTQAGAEAVDLGIVSTPSFYFAVGKKGYDGGIMISASHNPKEWNGFKMVRKKGLPVSGESGINELKDLILENVFVPAENTGSISQETGIIEIEAEATISQSEISSIKALKIVVDAANSMGATYVSALARHLPINLIKLNFTLDGSFPAHEADPLKEENLEELQKAVIAEKADLGIATDGDGDRIFFVDNNGETINPAIIRGLLAKIFLRDKPGAKIGYDVRPGQITVDMIKENGGLPIMTRVGHSLIKEQMLKEDIYFAGESSGHFYLNGPQGCFEYPGLMILKLLAEFSKAGTNVSDYIAPYKKYFASGEINISADKEKIFALLKEKYSDGEKSELDGLSIRYPEFWFNVRGSNTEAKVRLNLEALSQSIMAEKRDEVLSIMKSV